METVSYQVEKYTTKGHCLATNQSLVLLQKDSLVCQVSFQYTNLFDLRAFVIRNMKAMDAYGYMYGIYIHDICIYVCMCVCKISTRFLCNLSLERG